MKCIMKKEYCKPSFIRQRFIFVIFVRTIFKANIKRHEYVFYVYFIHK